MISNCSWWHSHHCLCLVLWTFYPFRSTFLVYLSQGLHVYPFDKGAGFVIICHKRRVINSYTFVQETKTREIYQDEVQVLYDVASLYPSIPVDEAINVWIYTSNNDKEQLKERTKLTLTDTYTLTELCLSKCYFLHENNLCLFQKSAPIRLSLPVVLTEFYIQKIKLR